MVQPFGAVAVMVIVVVWLTLVLLVTVPLMSPLPLAGIPATLALSRVQLKVVPTRLLLVLKTILAKDPVQTLWAAGVATVNGAGRTITSTVTAVDAQPKRVETIVKVVVWSIPVGLVKVPKIVADVPLAAMPGVFTVLFLVQLKVVLGNAFGLVRMILVIGNPAHTVCVAGAAATSGRGLTMTFTVVVLVPQPLVVADMVKITVCCTNVVLVNAPVMFVPLPLAAIPVTLTALSRVQL